MVSCPICGKLVRSLDYINQHIDSDCTDEITPDTEIPEENSPAVATFFQPSASKLKSKHGVALALPARKPHATTPEHAKRSFSQSDSRLQNPPKKTRLSLDAVAPLAERMRPQSLDDIRGQDLVAPGGLLRLLLDQGIVPSMILWGNTGTGKTTVARLVASMANAGFVEINSTSTGVAECKKIFSDAKAELQLSGRRTVLFCDEIHRFSRSQQEVFLAPVEAGTITLIAATTENPSFKIIAALLSRCRTFTLSPLTEPDIVHILHRAVITLFPSLSSALSLQSSADTVAREGSPQQPTPSEQQHHPLLRSPAFYEHLATMSSGDARHALTLLELALPLLEKSPADLPFSALQTSLTRTFPHDRRGDLHYDLISALHKSIRGSDANASLYWLARLLSAGEDPLFVARRLVVVASEDVGLADNSMLGLATATHDAVMKVGLPEARINLAHCVTALAFAPKSTRAYRGLAAAMRAIQEMGGSGTHGLDVPLHLRNATTRMMRDMGYGKAYKYNPNYLEGKVKQEYLPELLSGTQFLPELDLGDEIDVELNPATLAQEGIAPTEQTSLQ